MGSPGEKCQADHPGTRLDRWGQSSAGAARWTLGSELLGALVTVLWILGLFLWKNPLLTFTLELGSQPRKWEGHKHRDQSSIRKFPRGHLMNWELCIILKHPKIKIRTISHTRRKPFLSLFSFLLLGIYWAFIRLILILTSVQLLFLWLFHVVLPSQTSF